MCVRNGYLGGTDIEMDNDLKMEKRVDVLKKALSAENTADLVP